MLQTKFLPNITSNFEEMDLNARDDINFFRVNVDFFRVNANLQSL